MSSDKFYLQAPVLVQIHFQQYFCLKSAIPVSTSILNKSFGDKPHFSEDGIALKNEGLPNN
ncbi:MAG: hypothetical protein RLY40_1043 [Pseudomonadota bacterium]|jgi:hypothetical protein